MRVELMLKMAVAVKAAGPRLVMKIMEDTIYLLIN
jgi:hypothetical protein